MIAIIDYGVGNLFSLSHSLTAVGAANIVTGEAQTIARADRVILPGVGAFGDAAKKLRQTGLDLRHFDDAVTFKILCELKKCGQEKPKQIY